jgi:hypothetical protein
MAAAGGGPPFRSQDGVMGRGRSMIRTLYVIPAVVILGLSVPLGPVAIVEGHEHRQVGGVDMTVGWVDEPTFAGQKNAVQLLLKDSSGKSITDLGDTLQVQVAFGSQRTAPLPLSPAFGKSFGTPGDYRAAIIPTRPGNYTFHFVGTVGPQKIDQSFTTSDTTFDPVSDAAEIQFPVKDPSAGEMAGRLDRLGPRVDAAQSSARDARAAASQSQTLAVAGIIVGAVALVLSLRPRRGRPA